MAADHSIDPFPADIDRGRFADWLTGFADGEGCFMLRMINTRGRATPAASFFIGLRSDDRPILKLIQAFWACGHIRALKQRQSPHWGDQSRYIVEDATSLTGVVIPHFEACPLLAKKAADFPVWREAVLLMRDVQGRKQIGLGRGRGTKRKWADTEIARFIGLMESLRRSRTFVHQQH